MHPKQLVPLYTSLEFYYSDLSELVVKINSQRLKKFEKIPREECLFTWFDAILNDINDKEYYYKE